MPTIESLKREIARIKKENERKERKLRNISEGRMEMKQLGRQRTSLERELKQLKNPESTAFKRNVKKGLVSGGKGTARFFRNVMGAFEENDRRQRPRPTTKKKTPTRKSKTKRRKK